MFYRWCTPVVVRDPALSRWAIPFQVYVEVSQWIHNCMWLFYGESCCNGRADKGYDSDMKWPSSSWTRFSVSTWNANLDWPAPASLSSGSPSAWSTALGGVPVLLLTLYRPEPNSPWRKKGGGQLCNHHNHFYGRTLRVGTMLRCYNSVVI